jgi:exopolysaccharide production protein ExoZ
LAKLPSLQVLRGIAANLVVTYHLFLVDEKFTGGTLPHFLYYGTAGVDVFFVLSGFIMAAVAGQNVGPVQFLWRRVLRIYPTYWIVSLIVLAVSLTSPELVNSSIHEPISVWRSFLLIPQRTLPLLAVGWTLIHEMYFYVIFALILFFRVSVRAGLMVWALSLGIGWLLIPSAEIASSPVLRLVMSPLTAEFMMGAAVGLLYRNTGVHTARAAGAAGLFGLVASIGILAPALALDDGPSLEMWRVVLFGAPSALIIYSLADLKLRAPTWCWAGLVALGDWSYSTYLVHVLVVAASGRIIAFGVPAGAGAAVLLVTAGLLLANLAGAALFYGFERPVLRASKCFPSWKSRPT